MNQAFEAKLQGDLDALKKAGTYKHLRHLTTPMAPEVHMEEAGDVIVLVGAARTQSFEELTRALGAARGPTEISFVNGFNQKVEKLTVRPVDGKIGVAVVPVALR